MNKQMTISRLFELCKKEIAKGNGDKNIVISDDNEGNGFHGMFFGFTKIDEFTQDLIYDSQTNLPSDTIILG